MYLPQFCQALLQRVDDIKNSQFRSIPKAGHSAHSGRTVTTDIPLNNKFASLGTE